MKAVRDLVVVDRRVGWCETSSPHDSRGAKTEARCAPVSPGFTVRAFGGWGGNCGHDPRLVPVSEVGTGPVFTGGLRVLMGCNYERSGRAGCGGWRYWGV